MDNESNYPDLTEPGLRRKKKRKPGMDRSRWDNLADAEMMKMVNKSTGIDPFKKKKKGS